MFEGKNITRIFGLVATALFTSVTSSWGQCLAIKDGEGISAPFYSLPDKTVPLEPAFEDYMYMLIDACGVLGLEKDYGIACGIIPLMGEINGNAIATICPTGYPNETIDAIIYDRRLSGLIGYAGAQGVIAHEIGHHLCGHLNSDTSNPIGSQAQELEADTFAGAVLRELGWDLEAVFAFEPLLAKHASNSHPSKSKRLAALAKGWTNPSLALTCIK